ncbi:MAG: Asp-tRNA(Asn)/Glu-tRNA(Gln) amidotransferase subunit GatC [Patescibacteria group bacterium]
MKREDVAHLATLARIELSEAELTRLEEELSSIVSYVSAITDIAGDEADTAPQLGARFNVFRADEVTNQADEYTEDLLAELPQREGRYMKVKKILGGE